MNTERGRESRARGGPRLPPRAGVPATSLSSAALDEHGLQPRRPRQRVSGWPPPAIGPSQRGDMQGSREPATARAAAPPSRRTIQNGLEAAPRPGRAADLDPGGSAPGGFVPRRRGRRRNGALVTAPALAEVHARAALRLRRSPPTRAGGGEGSSPKAERGDGGARGRGPTSTRASRGPGGWMAQIHGRLAATGDAAHAASSQAMARGRGWPATEGARSLRNTDRRRSGAAPRGPTPVTRGDRSSATRSRRTRSR